GDKNFAAVHLLDTADDKPDSLIQRDPKPRHSRIGYRYPSSDSLLHENWYYASAAADNVSVARATEPRVLRARIGIGLHEHFFRAQLGGPVKIDGVNSLVSAERYDSADAAIDRSFNYILSAIDIGLDGFKRVVLTSRNLLERGSVDHDRDSRECSL